MFNGSSATITRLIHDERRIEILTDDGETSATTTTNSTNSSTPTRSPFIAAKAANTPG